ncbi:Cytochrome oxidase complex assembly protein 1 [Zhouia amylolytica]|uniref:Cytochrome oxidase complex assembly protein 1 n=2 Tax=Zhouia amylolytica TaxID=376730 RepID=W2UMS2_9FLAO|nr:cytochrome c oxidase assembly factor Coa1 family protein [Zhouia amylolytica]ETN94652.1 hypothetical protein P278_25950 [Zhouia amylolytica AD3]MCQ0111651.1 hypothetical protein [Zhouia amylolytica]SFS76198.1 Cytochrome oxidase complex assembly protein 1 [Zhouia amylolytica]
MNELSPKKSWWGRNWKWVIPAGGCLTIIIFIVVFIGTVFFGVSTMMKSSTPYEEAITRVKENKQIIEALGEPIVQEGMIQGKINYENDHGDIDIKVPLEGAKGKASLYIVGTKQGDTWNYSDMYIVIKATGETIFLLESEF